MINLAYAAGFFLICLALCAALTWLVLGWLRKRQVMDIPNERSSHALPTPRGGGLALLPVLALILAVTPGTDWPVFVGFVAVAGISWLDDLRNLPACIRLSVQGLAAALVLFFFPPLDIVPLLPSAIEILILWGGWVWFMNLYNFMDGIDGITGVESASIGLGLAAFGLMLFAKGPLLAGLGLTGAAIGFLIFNRHPAKLFMGDVGSVPLGYVIGLFLISLTTLGAWPVALILPLYYLADATVTLGRRILAGESPFKAHRSHFYQKAVPPGSDPRPVVRAIAATNIGLIALALLSAWQTWPAVIAAFVLVGLLLSWMSRRQARLA